MSQSNLKIDMRLCIQMTMMRRWQTNPTGTLAHEKKQLTIHQSKFDQQLVKRKALLITSALLM